MIVSLLQPTSSAAWRWVTSWWSLSDSPAVGAMAPTSLAWAAHREPAELMTAPVMCAGSAVIPRCCVHGLPEEATDRRASQGPLRGHTGDPPATGFGARAARPATERPKQRWLVKVG